MSIPLILTTTHRAIASADADTLRRAVDAYADFVSRAEPGLVALGITADDTEASVSLMHVFEDPRSADEHLAIASQHITDGFAIAETARISVVGTPGPRIRGLLAANRDAGVPTASVHAIAGFARR